MIYNSFKEKNYRPEVCVLPDTKRMQNIMYFLQQAILRTNIARIINPKASRDKLVKKLVLARNHSQTTKSGEIQVSSHCS